MHGELMRLLDRLPREHEVPTAPREGIKAATGQVAGRWHPLPHTGQQTRPQGPAAPPSPVPLGWVGALASMSRGGGRPASAGPDRSGGSPISRLSHDSTLPIRASARVAS